MLKEVRPRREARSPVDHQREGDEEGRDDRSARTTELKPFFGNGVGPNHDLRVVVRDRDAANAFPQLGHGLGSAALA
jgi:hypothetical protein